jgi:uncharacterized protein (DUF433 family)
VISSEEKVTETEARMTFRDVSYADRIASDPTILGGKPIIRGTRVPVWIVLQHLSGTLDLNDLFAAYPHITEDDVRACLDYAARIIDGESVTVAPVSERVDAESASIS